MADGPVLNKGTLANQVCTGVVQYAIPAFGWAMVIPAAGNGIDNPILCMPQANGGIVGAGTISVPNVGTTVTFRREKDTDIGYIISVNPTGTEPSTWKYVPRLRHSQFIPGVTDLDVVKTVIQTVYGKTNGKGKAVYVGGLQDQYEGDVYTADKKGPGIFYGRAQLTVRGSDLSYIEISALKDRIYTVTVESQFDTLTDKNTITTSLNKTLKASGTLQGLGGRPWDKTKPFKADEKWELVYQDSVKDPLFRYQHFQGGAAKGTYLSVVGALQEKKEETPVLVSQGTSYDGLCLAMSVQGKTWIKTPYVTGLTEKPFTTEQDTKERQEEIEQRLQKAKEFLDKFKDIKLSYQGVQRIAQLDAVIEKDTRALTADMLGSDVQALIKNQVDPFTEAFGDNLPWEGGQQPLLGQFLGGFQTADTKDGFTGKTVKRFNDNAIITQDPDGTITLKDGWGSQITMSHGNIYISSALDTFIRPGRDLISMVPRHLVGGANGEIELAAKKDIRVGSQKNLALASAIGGQDGYTVLQNRSKNTGNMIIRSNGKLVMTSSDDMHIGINDKRTVNNKEAANYSEGSVFIQGQRLRLESRDELRLMGKQVGVYGVSGTTGTGLQISSAALAMISPIIQMNTSSVTMGKFNNVYTVESATGEKKTITLQGGQESTQLHVRGQLQCKNIICFDAIQADGQCIAQSFAAIKAAQDKIPEVPDEWYTKFVVSLSRIFNSALLGAPLKFKQKFQNWYKDKFICDRELKFKDDWETTKVPTMCWQLKGTTIGKLKKIEQRTTGNPDKVTCAYPGSNGWKASMFTVDPETCQVKWQTTVQDSYTTHTKEE